MEQFISSDVLTAFAQVILIDLVLAGDNAIVIGLAAAGLPLDQRNKAILVGVLAATVLRIAFAGVTTQLLQVVGLLFAGGLLLLWVCWKMWRELRTSHVRRTTASRPLRLRHQRRRHRGPHSPQDTCGGGLAVVVADVTMSLDNVLAVAGARASIQWCWCSDWRCRSLSWDWRRDCASPPAPPLDRYFGLAVIFYVAVDMMVRGAGVEPIVRAALGLLAT
jgi:YjbE family integral membrane protein